VTIATNNQQASLVETQAICRQVLRQVTEHVQWQGNIAEAIKRSYMRKSRNTVTAAPPAKIHRNINPSDSEHVSRSILRTMYFPEIERRYEKISAAYQKTFNWVFQNSTSNAQWADFPGWARDESNPLYWITGKAGAGKSTLMRYIYDHSETRVALKAWAGNRPLITAFFFFWNSGSTMQMSYEGLVRALLYQILDQAPDLVSVVLPHRLELGILFGEHLVENEMYAAPWTWDELLRAFRLLINKCTKHYRIALFIDGMDEFQGNPSELIDFMTSLNAPGIKVCASSRPWVVFEDAFGHGPHLRLENLTHEDIKHYVASKMTASPGFRVLQELDAQISMKLVENVCRKSSGVFLWVALVTQSLLDGLSEGEKLSELQHRLDSLPEDLENLFGKILSRMDSKHFERAAQFFQLIRASLRPLSLLDMSFADEDDLDFALRAPRAQLTVKQVTSRAEMMRRRLNACCKGLLEAKRDSTMRLADTKIEYLHRSVRDYLEGQDTSAKLRTASRPDFNVNLRLYNAQIMRLKRQDPETLEDVHIWKSATYAIEYAVRADPSCSGRQMALLNEIDKVLVELTTTRLRNGTTYLQRCSRGSGDVATHWTWTKIDCRESKSFLGLAVQCQLTDYVEKTLQSMSTQDSARVASHLVNLAVSHYSVFPNEIDRPVVSHQVPNGHLIHVLHEYRAPYQKEETDHEISSRSRSRRGLLSCFCFG
jgi:hypothetical protein